MKKVYAVTYAGLNVISDLFLMYLGIRILVHGHTVIKVFALPFLICLMIMFVSSAKFILRTVFPVENTGGDHEIR